MQEKNILDFLHFSHPTDEQNKALNAMSKFVQKENNDDFLILCGAAGTGKTSITSALIGYLNALDRKYKISAPTGRAARILGKKAKITAYTIHSMIYVPKTNKETGVVKFERKIGHDSKPAVYIIDEASMIPKENQNQDGLFDVDNGLLYDLIAHVKGANKDNKIIFLGDHYQLPPIGENEPSALNKEFLETEFNLSGSAHLLTEVKRQEDGSYILENATAIREAIDLNKNNYPIEGSKSDNIRSAAFNFSKDFENEGPNNSVSIAVSNKASKYFNDLVRNQLFGRAKKILQEGDLLMVTQNWYRNGVQMYNGDHVIVEEIDWNIQEQVAGLHFVAIKIKPLNSDVIIEDYALLDTIIAVGGKIDSKKENTLRSQRYIKNRIFRESTFPSDDRYVGALRLMYGYGITCNKAQGGEWNKVYINTWGIPSLKWQYTAVTRAISEIETF